MKDKGKFEELDPKKIIEEMRQEYWSGVTEPEEEVDENRAQLLLVEMAGEQFGIQADRCKMITKLGHITRVPNMPPYILGVINLRGEIVSVVDLAGLFGLKAGERDQKTRMVVVQSGEVRTAMIVDRVWGIDWISMSRVRESEEAASDLKDEYIKGHIAPEQDQDQWITFLDIDKIVHGDEMSFSK